MNIVDLPINTPPYKNLDSVAIGQGLSDALIDGYMDEAGCTVKRPGLVEEVDLGTGEPVEGMYYWPETDKVIATSDGEAFALTNTAGVITADQLTGTGPGTGRCTFERDINVCYIVADQGAITQIEYDLSAVGAIVDADAPAANRTIGFINGRILTVDTANGYFIYSDPVVLGNPLAINPLSFQYDDAKPDAINGLKVKWGELFLFGKDSVNAWYNADGDIPFLPTPQAVMESGTEHPYTIVDDKKYIYFLDNTRQYVRMQKGYNIESVSGPVDRVLASLDIGNAYSTIINFEGHQWCKVDFPNATQTWIYDAKNGFWYQWGTYNTATGVHGRWIGGMYCYASSWNKHLLGSTLDGRVFSMSRTCPSDDQSLIRTIRRTGWIDHGTPDVIKGTEYISIVLKRGYGRLDYVGASTVNKHPSVLSVRWRDNGRPDWSAPRMIDLGTLGDTDDTVFLRALGSYRRRQYEISLTDNTGLTLVSAKEAYS